MLPEMRYVEQELLPMLRECAFLQEQKVQKQLRQWQGEKHCLSLMLQLDEKDVPQLQYLPVYNNEEIHYDPEKMFISQLRSALLSAFAKGDAVPSVRANVGCGCINTLIGGLKQNYFPDKMPWLLEHLTSEQIMEIGPEDITDSPEFIRGLEQMRYMKEMLTGTGIEVFPMDIQGPVDMAHLWLGNEFFYLLYDEPEVIHHALRLSVECIDYAFRKNLEIIAPTDHVSHYNCLALPVDMPAKISEDTSTLISKEHLEEFMLPYTKEVFSRLGGGYIHYCGNNEHLLSITEQFPNSRGLNFGNPERHHPEEVFKVLGDHGKFYLQTGQVPWSLEDQIRFAAREDGTFNIFPFFHCRKEEQSALLEQAEEYVRQYAKA